MNILDLDEAQGLTTEVLEASLLSKGWAASPVSFLMRPHLAEARRPDLQGPAGDLPDQRRIDAPHADTTGDLGEHPCAAATAGHQSPASRSFA